MKSLILLGFVNVAFILADAQEAALDPEETSFTYTRCMEDHFGDDFALLGQWMNWELPKDDAKTPCYVKCVLVGMELFDPATNSFKADNIVAQQKRYSQFTAATEKEAAALQSAFNKAGSVPGGDCKAVFDAYMTGVHADYAESVRKIFLGSKEVVTKIIENDSSVKRRDESIFRYCEKKFYEYGDPDLCKIRQGAILDSDVFVRHMKCVMKGLRYVDRKGNKNPAEVKRDLHQVGVTNKDAEVDKVSEGCANDAVSYYKCLFGSSFKESMMPALDYREIRSMSYSYKLKPNTPPYNAEEIRAQVVKIDQLAGCNL